MHLVADSETTGRILAKAQRNGEEIPRISRQCRSALDDVHRDTHLAMSGRLGRVP
jgi:hypothetical protein